MKKIYTLLILTFTISITSFAQVENALHFDGIDDNIAIANASSLIANQNQFSMTFWVYPENAAPAFPDYDGYCGFRNNTNADFYIVQLTDNYIEARFRNSNSQVYDIIDTTLMVNSWTHFAFIYDGNQISLYHDGRLIDSVSATGNIASAFETFHIGNLIYSGNNFNLHGKMDEVSLWNRGLLANEVTCIYEGNIDTASSGLVLYYKFDQGSPGGNNSTVNTLIPQRGNLNGALNNFALSGAVSNWVSGVENFITVLGSICDGQAYTLGSQTLSTPGIYYESFQASNGCDSIVRLTLSSIVNTNVTQAGPVFTSSQAGATYQWINCDSGNAIISGETAQMFTATADGNYAVIVTYNSCTDTSECYYFSVTGLNDLKERTQVILFPNPSSDRIYFSNLSTNTTISICDLSGREILKAIPDELTGVDISMLARGTYLVKIVSEYYTEIKYFVKR